MNAQAKKLASPILGVPKNILHMVEILKEPIFVVLLIRPREFEAIPRECHRVKRECHHISSNSKKFSLEEGFGNQCHHDCQLVWTNILTGDRNI